MFQQPLVRNCLSVASMGLVLSSCAPPSEEQVIALKDCGAVSVNGMFALTIEQHPVSQLQLTVPLSALNHLRIEKKGNGDKGTRDKGNRDEGKEVKGSGEQSLASKTTGLSIHSAADTQITGKLHCQQLTSLHLTGPSEVVVGAQLAMLEDVRLYGNSAANISKIFVEESSVRASASASLNVESIDADKLSVAAGGESQVALAGEVAQARMEAVGNAQLDAWELSVQHLELRCIGNSKVVVAPSAHLTGKALGSCAVANVGGGDVSLSVEDQATLD